jgi:Sec-independent protein translocase protein TatA
MAFENVLIVVMLVGFVFFGSKKLPELARAIGRSQIEFEMARSKAINEAQSKIVGRDLASGYNEREPHNHLYRVKLEKAASRAGVQNPEHLTDEELTNAIKLYLNEI